MWLDYFTAISKQPIAYLLMAYTSLDGSAQVLEILGVNRSGPVMMGLPMDLAIHLSIPEKIH